MSRKLMVSCPLAKDGSMVGSGATVLMRKFGSIVGTSVCAAAGAKGVAVGDDDPSSPLKTVTGGERGELVGVQRMGWKGVGVGDGFGAEVTIAKGSDGGAGALLPHPASKRAVMIDIRQMGFIVWESG